MTPPLTLEQLYSTTLRAFSRHPKAHIHLDSEAYPAYRLYHEQLTIGIDPANTPVLRGIADSHAAYLRFHRPDIYQYYLPTSSDPLATSIYEAAEWARVEALGMQHLPGLKQNITQKIGYDIEHMPPVTRVSLPYPALIRLLILQASTDILLPATLLSSCTPLEATLRPYLDRLGQILEDQAVFAQEVRALLTHLIPDSSANSDALQPAPPSETTVPDQADASLPSDTSQGEEVFVPSSTHSRHLSVESTEDTPFSDPTTFPEPSIVYPESSRLIREAQTGYTVYSNTFDQIVHASTLGTEAELTRLRKQLDLKLAMQPAIPKPHANRLLRQLLTQQQASWHYNLEEGLLDSARLAYRVANPNYPSFYKQRFASAQYHTVVTLLLDNSGSMRGRPITLAAMSAELLAKLLEICGIKVEILGFTTVEWKGGQSRQQWEQHHSPSHPGRLNDLRHIIYKAADTPWRKARRHMGLMLKEGILKENIDGEAILWAYTRLRNRPEHRRILMVISDGAPVDDSTLSANHASYLDDHLRQVVSAIEKEGKVEIVAIGIGHDVNRYYNHAVTIKDAKELSETMFKELSTLFSKRNEYTALAA